MRSRGQSLVELAITLPVVLLMILFGIDFGRVFLGWVTLNNAVREAANFAAINPDAWSFPGSPAARTEYARLVNAESAGMNCALPNPLPDPSFPSGTSIGSPAVVVVTCQFSLITPIIGNILGDAIPVSASASFPIRKGVIAGTPGGGGPLPTALPTPPFPTPSQVPTPSPAPTPPPQCRVPVLENKNSSVAVADWTGAGFQANNLAFNPLVPPHYRIKTQSLAKNTWVACGSTMTVAP